MKELMKGKLEGFTDEMKQFTKHLEALKNKSALYGDYKALMLDEMERLGFDECATDKYDNILGTMKGYKQGQDIALVFHLDYNFNRESNGQDGPHTYIPGMISAIYSAALLKRTLLPLNGDLIICGVPRSGFCEFGIKQLFETYLSKRVKQLKGVYLCEPTDMNIFLGHKGRMEYEILVKATTSRDYTENRGINMLGTMFPLIHELESVSHNLPYNYSLGNSSLRIKDVHFNGTNPTDKRNEFRVTVDRVFVPEEQQENILERAKMIAEAAYKGEPNVMVETAVAKHSTKTIAGMELVSKKEIKPWTMESHHPFVMNSLQALTDNDFKSTLGYWKKTFTEGAYTCGQLGIPTLGFGVEAEIFSKNMSKPASIEEIKKAVFGQAMMIHRNIGVPTFGWSSDDI